MNECVVCGKYINPHFWVCKSCEIAHGLVDVDYKDWPDWVKALKTIEQRNRRYNQRVVTIGLTEVE